MKRLLIFLGVVALGGCGHALPLGERLTSPATYGPPFGSALRDNVPHHPHYPAARERYALTSEHGARHFRSGQACQAALTAAVGGHGPHQRVERISSVEWIGLYEHDGEVHEYRCAGGTLTHRSWCRGESHAAGGGHDARKAPDEACKAH